MNDDDSVILVIAKPSWLEDHSSAASAQPRLRQARADPARCPAPRAERRRPPLRPLRERRARPGARDMWRGRGIYRGDPSSASRIGSRASAGPAVPESRRFAAPPSGRSLGACRAALVRPHRSHHQPRTRRLPRQRQRHGGDQHHRPAARGEPPRGAARGPARAGRQPGRIRRLGRGGRRTSDAGVERSPARRMGRRPRSRDHARRRAAGGRRERRSGCCCASTCPACSAPSWSVQGHGCSEAAPPPSSPARTSSSPIGGRCTRTSSSPSRVAPSSSRSCGCACSGVETSTCTSTASLRSSRCGGATTPPTRANRCWSPPQRYTRRMQDEWSRRSSS